MAKRHLLCMNGNKGTYLPMYEWLKGTRKNVSMWLYLACKLNCEPFLNTLWKKFKLPSLEIRNEHFCLPKKEDLKPVDRVPHIYEDELR